MSVRSTPRWLAALALVLTAGCLYPVREKIDHELCDLVKDPIDLQPATTEEPPPLTLMPAAEGVEQTGYQKAGEPGTSEAPPPGRGGDEFIYRPRVADPTGPGGRLTLPPTLLPRQPVWPRSFRSEEEKRRFYRQLFKPLPPLGADPQPAPGPNGMALTLTDLQRIAMTNSPALRQAQAAVEAARGNAYQAGLWPNPTVGFEIDTFGTTGGAGYVGGWVEQVIKTAGKLQLTRAVAVMDLRNAELDLRRAQSDLVTRVRRGYFQVLVARENIRLSHLLADFAERAYQEHMATARTGGLLVARYEPIYFRYLAVQSRNNLVAARNHYISTWKQLVAAMGTPGLPLTDLAGRADMPVPLYDYEQVLRYVLRHHSDRLKAETSLQQAQLNLQLARVQPYPDVDVRLLVQRDYTGPPFEVSPSIQVGVPLPIWNHNQGGIRQAQANLVQASDQPHTIADNLTSTLTDAYERYSTNREQLAYYRDLILPDLIRVYTAIQQRYYVLGGEGGAGPGFNDLIVAQGNLAGGFAGYITTLDAMWGAVVDVTDLLQTRDLFQLNGFPTPTECLPGIPDMADLPKLPCAHPCSPLPGAHLNPPDGSWPPAVAPEDTPRMKSADEETRRGRPEVPAAPTPAAFPLLEAKKESD
jgi:cobalt-zinc-cadmium efflux system outer membrane protein